MKADEPIEWKAASQPVSHSEEEKIYIYVFFFFKTCYNNDSSGSWSMNHASPFHYMIKKKDPTVYVL